MRKFAIIVAALLAVVFAVSAVSALPQVVSVKINGNTVTPNENLVVNRGDTLNIQVKVTAASGNDSNVEISGEILGYEHNSQSSDLYDRAPLFDMQAGDTRIENLKLTVPTDAQQDHYALRIQVGSRTGPTNESDYTLHLTGQRHQLVVSDITFNPDKYVQSGRAFLSQVRVKNIGSQDEQNVKVTLSMPKAGVEASTYIDRIRSDQSESTSDMFLRVPNCLASGTYDVVAKITYDDGYESASYTTQVNVVSDAQLCNNQSSQQRVLIEVQPPQPVQAGGSTVFPVLVTNSGSQSQTLALTVSGADSFGSARVTPSQFIVVPPNGRSTAYVEVSANKDATAGTKIVSLSLATASGTQLGSSAVPVTVQAAQQGSAIGGSNWQRVLEISLLVLVVILIVLGIIVAVSRMRDDEREGGEGSQAYY